MIFSLTKKQVFTIVLVIGLMISLMIALKLAGTRQDIRKKAAGATMTMTLYPVQDTLIVGQSKVFELKATFTNGSSTEKLDYLKTELSFNSNYIKVPDGKYIDTSGSDFGKIIRIDGPTVANDAGKIILELGALSSGAGPSTDKPLTIAKFYFEGKGVTPSSQDVKIGETQAVNNQSGSVNVTSQSAKYLVTLATGPTTTPTPIIIGDPECGLTGGVCRSSCQINETEIQALGCSSPQPKCCKLPAITPTPTAPPAVCLTLPQSDNFADDPQTPSLWNNWNSLGGVVIQDGLGQLKVSVPGGNGFAGVITKNKVCSDFDVRVDFSQFTTSGQPEGNARLVITDQIIDNKNVEVVIQRYKKGNEQGFWTDMKKPDGTFFGGTAANSTATSGILRIRRQGNIFTTYYDDGNGWKKSGYFPSGFTSNANIVIGVGSWMQNPSVSANFDNFNLTAAIPDPSVTPIPSGTPVPTASPSPTPPSGREKYIIDAGDKQSLVINIGPAINPQIKFKAKLASLRAYPELYLKLRVKDELAFLDKQNNSTVSSDTCNNPTAPDRDFLIPMKATGEVYSPVQQISQPAPAGVQVANVNGDGWVILDGMVPGRYYTLFLKGPKTRKGRMIEHFLLQPNQVQSQDFDWSGKLLDPGDLPDPANGNKQDCTINSADWSLEKARIGSNDGTNLAVCDVNYDGICNAGDSVAILDTLSKRPDDDQ